jgi:hypothetical protein
MARVSCFVSFLYLSTSLCRRQAPRQPAWRSLSLLFLFLFLSPLPLICLCLSSSLTYFPAQLSKTPKANADAKEEEDEALLPGALYAECAVVRTPAIAPPPTTTTPPNSTSKSGKEKPTQTGVKQEEGDEVETEDERAGRLVWEAYEAGLRAWEAANPSVPAKPQADEGADTSS